LVCAIFLELFSYIHRERPNRFDSFAKVPYIELLKTSKEPIRSYGNFWAFYPNCATGFGVDDLGFFMGLAPKRFVHFVNEIISPDLFQNNFRSPALRSIPIIGREEFLDMLNVRYIIQASDDRFVRPFRHFGNYTSILKKVYEKEVRVFQRPNALPRSFMVYQFIQENDPQKIFELLNTIKSRFDETAIITSSKSIKPFETNINDPGISRIDFKTYTPNRVALSTTTIYPGLLVLSDAYHPDWKAYIDGKRTEIYQTNYLIRSVFLPEGRHEIVFVFRPIWFYAGMAVSILSLLIIALMLLQIKRA
jgi:hypothetical protein